MMIRKLLLAACLSALQVSLAPLSANDQGLDPALLLKLPTDAWPTYNGDYSGRRYSPLKQINADNVKNLTLAWIYRANTSPQGAVVGGEGLEIPPSGGGPGAGAVGIKSTPLMVNGVLYFASPDHAWAVDARTGRQLWHYFWRTRAATTSATAAWGCTATGCTS